MPEGTMFARCDVRGCTKEADHAIQIHYPDGSASPKWNRCGEHGSVPPPDGFTRLGDVIAYVTPRPIADERE